jgi:hypothetical protein
MLPSVNGTSVWIPILSAVAALFGAGVGAALQGRYGVTGWRRQIRLEAYTKFLNEVHSFDNLLFDTLNTMDDSNFDEMRQKLQEVYSQLQSAGTLVAVAGPKRVDVQLASVLNNASAVVRDMQTSDNNLISIAHEWKKDRSYDKWVAWIQSIDQLADVLRKFLRTE